jgi:putative MFS transporter
VSGLPVTERRSAIARRLGDLARRTAGVDAREWRLLALLGTANAVNGYDLGILTLALPAIQASLGIAEDQVGTLLAVIRLGMLPALALGVLADRWGRRSLLLATIVGFTLCTVMTAAAPGVGAFVAAQFVARIFIAAEDTLGIVVVAEEIAAVRRGFGLGVLAALGGIGHGLAAVSYAVVGSGPYGWRLLYLAGALPLVVVAWLRRSLVETRRFVAHRARHTGETHAFWAPLAALVREHPGRVVALVAMILPIYFVTAPALAFQSKFLQEAHGYTPAAVATLYFVGGLVSVATQLMVGRVSDAAGRKPAVLITTALIALGALMLYRGTGPAVLAGWLLMVAAYLGLDVMLSALGSELFPTAYRSTASAARAVTATCGAATGLALEGILFKLTGTHGAAITWMLLPLVIVPIALAALPETAERELEEIADS